MLWMGWEGWRGDTTCCRVDRLSLARSYHPGYSPLNSSDPSTRNEISLIHPLTHHGQTSEYTALRDSPPALLKRIVKVPSDACGAVTVRSTLIGGGRSIFAETSASMI
jgi:hypothetical protein